MLKGYKTHIGVLLAVIAAVAQVLDANGVPFPIAGGPAAIGWAAVAQIGYGLRSRLADILGESTP